MKSFQKKLLLVLSVLLWVLVGQIAKAEGKNAETKNVKVETLELFDEGRQRPLKLTIWYPANRECKNARMCLANSAQLHQSALISHGAMGSALNYNWIGYALASQGIVVAGLNHYGESYVYGQEHADHKAALRFWERPEDVRFALDVLASNKVLNSPIFDLEINWNNVTGIGHSSGGATMIAAIGGNVELAQASNYCASHTAKTDKSCAYLRHLPKSFQIKSPQAQSFKDSRIQRVIALDPALGHIMTKESLQGITKPVMIIGSTQNDFLVYQAHAGFYAKTIPNAQLLSLDSGEGHFVYLDSCTHEHEAMGVSLCQDRKGVDRDAVHQRTYPSLFRFIYSQ